LAAGFANHAVKVGGAHDPLLKGARTASQRGRGSGDHDAQGIRET
jgi:hypothetical protein